MLSEWKHQEFRIFVTKANKEITLKKYRDEVQNLQHKIQLLENSKPEVFTYAQGKNKTKLKQLLNWDDDTATSVIARYKMTKTTKNTKRSSIMKFLEAVMS